MRIHLIAIGGAVMHALAIALQQQNHQVTGSDDIINDPARKNLLLHKLFPEKLGWQPELITGDIDVVVVGMHAKPDNPEYLRAQQLNLKIQSFPEVFYEHSKFKKRVVIAGSHGKTTVTAMLMHALKTLNADFDYALGSAVEGFANPVKFSDAPLMVIEGDEYLTSPWDSRPKMMHYHPHLALINGVEWDHANVFPTEKIYLQQFTAFLEDLEEDSRVAFHGWDPIARRIVCNSIPENRRVEIHQPNAEYQDGRMLIIFEGQKIPMEVFGQHNAQNLMAATALLTELGFSAEEALRALSTFKGAGRRLEVIGSGRPKVYQDFAHAPSKVLATVKAVRAMHPDDKIAGLLELHTFSSLMPEFIFNYAHSLYGLDMAVVFVDSAILKLKGAGNISDDLIKKAFGRDDILICHHAEELKELTEKLQAADVVLIMTSGNLGGIDPKSLV